MNICMFTNTYLPHVGGVARSVAFLAEDLRKGDHRVLVVAPTFEIYKGRNMTSPLSYAVAKAGIIHFVKWVAARYGEYNIRCNAVSPGGVSERQHGGSEFEQIYSSRTPLRRMARSKNVAEVVRFLMSDKSDYITGHNIMVDGGWTIY